MIEYAVRQKPNRWFNRKPWYVVDVRSDGTEQTLSKHYTMAEALQEVRALKYNDWLEHVDLPVASVNE